MTDYIKEPHTATITGQIECGKTHLVLDLIEKEHSKHLITFLSYVQHFNIIRHAILRNG